MFVPWLVETIRFFATFEPNVNGLKRRSYITTHDMDSSGLEPGEQDFPVSRSRELRDFLVARRARRRAREFGLPERGVRRTPGLRRTEIADLVGVSEEWYTRFERGANLRVSRSFVDRLAAILKLDDVERAYLFRLVGFIPPDTLMAQPPDLESLQALIDRYSQPAAVYTRWYDIIAFNEPFGKAFHYEDVDDPRMLNSIWRLFFDKSRRTFYEHWSDAADRAVGFMRYAFVGNGDHPRFREVIAQLLEHPEFSRRWQLHDVGDPVIEAFRFDLTIDGFPPHRAFTFDVPGRPEWMLLLDVSGG